MRDSVRIFAALCMLLPGTAWAQAALQVVTADGHSTQVSLSALPRRTGVTEDRGLKTTFDGVELREVLAAAGVRFGEALRGKALAQVVVASARDGYQVAYAIAELDSAFTDRIVLVADQRDGKPLLPDTGPLQIVVIGEKRAARWIRQLTKLEVRQLQ